jgi:hypothetical protein
MKTENIDTWGALRFKTISFRTNFDLIDNNENFITEYAGTISKLRIHEYKPPVPVGEFSYSVWDIGLALKLGYNLKKLVKRFKIQNAYVELDNLIVNNTFTLEHHSKLVVIHTIVLHPDYRKIEVTEELIESIYRENRGATIIALVQPIQYNFTDFEHFTNNNNVQIRYDLEKPNEFTNIRAIEYYELNKFLLNDDLESSQYKLYALASRCGFNRISESDLFILDDARIINRMVEKITYIKKTRNV